MTTTTTGRHSWTVPEDTDAVANGASDIRSLAQDVEDDLPHGVIGYATTSVATTGIVGTEVDVTGLTVTANPLASRLIRVSWRIRLNGGTADDPFVFRLYEDTTVVQTWFDLLPLSNSSMAADSVLYVPGAGSVTWKLTAQRFGGSGTWGTTQLGTNSNQLVVEDVGPA